MHPSIRVSPLAIAPDISAALVHYRPLLTQEAHAHDHHQVSFVLCGELQEGGEGTRRTLEVLQPSLGIKPAGFKHVDSYGAQGALLLSLSIHRSNLEGVDLTDWQWRAIDPLDLGPKVLNTLRVVVEGRVPDPMEGMLDLLALAKGCSSLDSDHGLLPDWLIRARRALHDDPSLSMQVVAQDCGVHPVHLSRFFSLRFGCTPTVYRANCRLSRALDLLLSGAITACEAAHEAGFSDQSHFNREMRRFTGLTPSRFQALFSTAG